MDKLGTEENPFNIDDLDGTARYIIAVANGALTNNSMTDEQRRKHHRYMPHGNLTAAEMEQLSKCRDKFGHHAALLSQALKHPMSDEVRTFCGHLIRKAITDAFRIGQLATYNPIVMRLAEEGTRSRMSVTRAAKPSYETVNDEVRRCLQEHLAVKPSESGRTPNNLAGSIESAVNLALSPDKKYRWGASAIAKHIREIRRAEQKSD